MHMPETEWRQHFEGPIRLRHSPRDLLEILRLAAAQQPPKFGKVERGFPVGRRNRRRQGPLKPKPSYQATKDHGSSSAMTSKIIETSAGTHIARNQERLPDLRELQRNL
jgi:hypothetical protein